MDEYAAAEEKKKQKAAFTNQIAQLGGMALGAGLAPLTGGLSLGLTPMAAAGLGGTVGGLAGNAISGTPVSMNQGVNALMQVGGLMDSNSRASSLAQSREINDMSNLQDMGYVPYSGEDMGLDDFRVGGQIMTPGGAKSQSDMVTSAFKNAPKNADTRVNLKQGGLNITYTNQKDTNTTGVGNVDGGGDPLREDYHYPDI